MTIIKCPNCGIRHRIALFPLQKTQQRKNVFQSVAQPPKGRLRSLLWFMNGNRYSYPAKQNIKLTVRSEIKTSKHQMLINELEIPATLKDLQQLADIYIRLGKSWSRKNSTEGTRITQPTHLKLQEALLELKFLYRINSTQYTLTDAGYRFLRHFISA